MTHPRPPGAEPATGGSPQIVIDLDHFRQEAARGRLGAAAFEAATRHGAPHAPLGAVRLPAQDAADRAGGPQPPQDDADNDEDGGDDGDDEVVVITEAASAAAGPAPQPPPAPTREARRAARRARRQDTLGRLGLPEATAGTFLDPQVRESWAVRARWSARHHAARTPTYLWRCTTITATGAWVTVHDAAAYLVASDDFGYMIRETKRDLRRTTGKVGHDPHNLAGLRRERRDLIDERLHERRTVLGLGAAGSYVAAVASLGVLYHWAVLVPAIAPVLLAAFLVGYRHLATEAREDGSFSPVLDAPPTALQTPDAPLTSDDLNQALVDIKVLRADQQVELVGLIGHQGDATVAVFDLPVEAKALLDKKDALAGRLKLDPIQVELHVGAHASQVVMRLAKGHPFTGPPVPSPLEDADRWDVWRGSPMLVTTRGEIESVPLMFAGLLSGARPRKGKTFSARAYAAAAVLDPVCRLVVADGKGGKDWSATRDIAEVYISNASDDSAYQLMVVLEDLVGEFEETYRRLAEMSDEDCPEGQLTPELTARFGFRPLLLIVDEAHLYTNCIARPNDDNGVPDKKERTYGARIAKALEYLVKIAPAAGLIPVILSQKPTDDAIPSEITSVMAQSIAHLCGSRQMSEAILGANATAAGFNAAVMPGAQPGEGIHGLDGTYQRIRSVYIDLPTWRAICRRGRELREEAGLLKPADTAPVVTGILGELLAIFAASADPDKLTTSALLAALADRDPQGWSPQALGATADTYTAIGGTALRQAIAGQLQGTDRALQTTEKWRQGQATVRGYSLAMIRAYAGI